MIDLRAIRKVRSNSPMTVATTTTPWLVISDDWGRHPTSCQHLIRHALPERSVTWVNMIGTRRPKLDRATLIRGWEKLGQWLRRPMRVESLPENLHVVSPKVWPGFRRRWERRFNRALLKRQLASALDEIGEPPIAIATMPTAADLIGVLPVRKWVYYCVDDFSAWPGIDQVAARRLEDRLIDKADTIVAVSDALMERIEKRGRTAKLLTHGVDLEYWASESPSPLAPLPRTTPHPKCRGERRKTVLFWGLIDRRMDVDFVRALSEWLTDATILVVGPQDNPDIELMQLQRVRIQPGVSLAELPKLATEADVLIMPYIDAPVTRAMQPLKLKEYLATGKPVVVRDLPSNREWADALDLAATPQEFVNAVQKRLATGIPDAQRSARQRLQQETWSAKSRQFAAIVDGLV
jgi:glycosyltransferase involved in cell wall biosynthesis